jgi:hypothetical protein
MAVVAGAKSSPSNPPGTHTRRRAAGVLDFVVHGNTG